MATTRTRMGGASLARPLGALRVSPVALATVRFLSVALAAILRASSVVLAGIPEESAAAITASRRERPPYVGTATTRSAHTTQELARVTAVSGSGSAIERWLIHFADHFVRQ